MDNERLEQSDFEDLSAHLDGRLPAERAAQIERLVRQEPDWRAAWEDLQALDALMESPKPPEADADLPDRIVRAVRRQARRSAWARVLRVAIPAAAAAVLLVVFLSLPDGAPDPAAEMTNAAITRTGETPEPNAPLVEAFAAENLDLCRDFDVLENYETLEAVEKVESGT